MAKKNPGKSRIILLVAVFSIVLYFSGVISGLYANKILKEETKKDIGNLKYETKQNLESLQSYVDFLDTNLKDMQLEQVFLDTLSRKDMCNFSRISMNELVSHLRFYWSRLPYRIEDYENNNKVTEEYTILKDQYAHLSIRTWILAKSEYDKCNMNIVHGLYFYSINCKDCVKQGEEIDRLSKKIAAARSDMIMFPIDFNSNQTIILNLKEFYGINSTPAIIINDKVFQGRLFTAEELTNFPNRIYNKK